jgi:GAF domain-containing protein
MLDDPVHPVREAGTETGEPAGSAGPPVARSAGDLRPGAHRQREAPPLGDVMGDVARTFQQEHGNVETMLAAITAAAVINVPGADECGISLVVNRRKVESRAPTSELPFVLDTLQDTLGEGPCLSAVHDERTVRLEDMRVEERWPRFTAEAARLGVGSMLTFQLFVAGSTLGALNLYAHRAHAFDQEAESVGRLFAGHAAIALAGAQQEHRLRGAIENRDVIGQAKGILMERFKITAVDAFRLLATVSSRTNRQVIDIAEELCTTGALSPTPPAGPGQAYRAEHA